MSFTLLIGFAASGALIVGGAYVTYTTRRGASGAAMSLFGVGNMLLLFGLTTDEPTLMFLGLAPMWTCGFLLWRERRRRTV